jgi:flagellar biosynthesis anti-sigma factor FlgM
MQINNKDTSLDGLKTYAGASNLVQRHRSATGTTAGSESSSEDGLSLTQQLSLLARALGTEPVDREQRIEQLARELEAGTYQVDSSAVARVLVEEWLARPEDF